MFYQLKKDDDVSDQSKPVLAFLSEIQDADKFYRKKLLEERKTRTFNTK
jgi:hypothetical protein